MNTTIDIIEYLSGLTGFVFDKSVLKRIAFDRGVLNIEDCNVLTKQQKELLLADLLYTAYCSPNVMASYSTSHGSFSKSIGSQTIDKEHVYKMFVDIYKRYDDEMLEKVDGMSNNIVFIDCFDY